MTPPRRVLATSLGLALLGAGLSPLPSPAEVSYAGSSTILASILYEGAIAAFARKTGVKLRIADPQSGSGKGMEMVLAGEVDVAGVSREIRPEETSRGAVGNLIGYDALAVWVNADNPVKGIELEEVAGILTGEIRTWKKLGGRAEPIVVFIQEAGAGRATFDVLNEKILKGRPVGTGFDTSIINTRDQIVAVSRQSRGFCIASAGVIGTIAPELARRVKPLPLGGVAAKPETVAAGTYPLGRPLYLVTLGPPQGETRLFIEFMRGKEGQAIVGRNFLPVRGEGSR